MNLGITGKEEIKKEKKRTIFSSGVRTWQRDCGTVHHFYKKITVE